MSIITNRTYCTPLQATTDLHAGGVFFAIIYVDCLMFIDADKVLWTKRVIDPFRPLDNKDVERIRNFRQEGTYSINSRGYIEINFPLPSMHFTGLYNKELDILVFDVYSSRIEYNNSVIFSIEKEDEMLKNNP